MEGSGIGDLVAGGLGGSACVLAGQPLDTVKVKIQTYPQLYRSVFHGVSKTFQENGLRGFYAGCTPSVVSSISENAVLFVFYGHCLRVVQRVSGVESASDMTTFQRATAGSLASVFSSIVITPPDLVKCKLQARSQLLATAPAGSLASRLPNSAWAIVKNIVMEEGVLGLYRGLTSVWTREVPGYFFFFGGYTASRKILTPAGGNYEDLGVWRLALAGGLAGCCFWTAIFPIDVVKSRIQVRDKILYNPSESEVKGELSGSLLVTLFQVIRNEGVRALYKGLLASCMRSFPANGALFITYEYSRLLFQ